MGKVALGTDLGVKTKDFGLGHVHRMIPMDIPPQSPGCGWMCMRGARREGGAGDELQNHCNRYYSKSSRWLTSPRKSYQSRGSPRSGPQGTVRMKGGEARGAIRRGWRRVAHRGGPQAWSSGSQLNAAKDVIYACVSKVWQFDYISQITVITTINMFQERTAFSFATRDLDQLKTEKWEWSTGGLEGSTDPLTTT